MDAERRSHIPQGAKIKMWWVSWLQPTKEWNQQGGKQTGGVSGYGCTCVCVCAWQRERRTGRRWQRETGRHREIWMTLSLEGLVWGYSVLGSNPPKKWTTGNSEIREKAKTVRRCFIPLLTAVTWWLWIPLSPPRSHTEHPGTVQKGAKLT